MTDSLDNTGGAGDEPVRPPPPARTPHFLLGAERLLIVLGGLVLFLMMAMTAVDVIGRYIFNAPLGFAYELTQMGMALLVLCALPSVTLRSEHVTVGLFESAFAGRVGQVRDVLVALLVVGISVFLAWRLYLLAARLLAWNDRTPMLGMSTGLFIGLASLAFVLISLAALVILASTLIDLFRGKPK